MKTKGLKGRMAVLERLMRLPEAELLGLLHLAHQGGVFHTQGLTPTQDAANKDAKLRDLALELTHAMTPSV